MARRRLCQVSGAKRLLTAVRPESVVDVGGDLRDRHAVAQHAERQSHAGFALDHPGQLDGGERVHAELAQGSMRMDVLVGYPRHSSHVAANEIVDPGLLNTGRIERGPVRLDTPSGKGCETGRDDLTVPPVGSDGRNPLRVAPLPVGSAPQPVGCTLPADAQQLRCRSDFDEIRRIQGKQAAHCIQKPDWLPEMLHPVAGLPHLVVRQRTGQGRDVRDSGRFESHGARGFAKLVQDGGHHRRVKCLGNVEPHGTNAFPLELGLEAADRGAVAGNDDGSGCVDGRDAGSRVFADAMADDAGRRDAPGHPQAGQRILEGEERRVGVGALVDERTGFRRSVEHVQKAGLQLFSEDAVTSFDRFPKHRMRFEQSLGHALVLRAMPREQKGGARFPGAARGGCRAPGSGTHPGTR